MINIAICDDNIELCNAFEKYSNTIMFKKNIALSVKIFHSGELLLDYYKFSNEKFNIIFLDVDMGVNKLSGIETAKKIRESIDKKVHIVFLTGYPQYMSNSFYVQASNYLIKPINYVAFEKEILRLCNLMSNAHRNIYMVRTIETSELSAEDITLNLDEVLYFKTNTFSYRKSETYVITTKYNYKNPLKITKPIGKIMDDLKDNVFINIYKSTFVNANHIESFIVNSNTFKLDNGEILYYSRGKLTYFREETLKIKMRNWY